MGLPCVSLLGSQLAPEDIIGIPQIEGDTSEFLPPKMVARKEPYVLFLDELNACSQEVQLGKWFDEQFPPLEKNRTYARPSRRQGSTPDIPRPNYVLQEKELESRTFGVVIDTSGSMRSSQIGLALGSIASYAVSKDVPFVQIIFCDAEATDAGYMAPEDIAGRVEITGRGGTILQPGVDALERAKDFPVTSPILIITDGYIEENLKAKREHAYLITNRN